MPFDAAKLKAALREIRKGTREINFGRAVSRARALLAEASVALVLTPEFKGSRLSGAACWLAPDKAVIQLSMRYKSNDQFRFSLFHEAGHLLERTRGQYVDSEVGRKIADPAEKNADPFARDWLIPLDLYGIFVRVGLFSEEAVAEFAQRQEIAPGIVVGRLQREDLLPPSHLNHMKTPIQWRDVA
jgi:Zn-dependent peptidase ImmA (M78 family)